MTVERIAAGEVVERPASVVKELVENSVDAGATTVSVRITGGGIERISVSDDGAGIPPEELELAIERHATSKLDPKGPVEAIGTLGFRGEALAAIASVARLELTSRTAERDVAEAIRVAGGAGRSRAVTPRAPGTTVEVRDLFFNTPARRKFLKSPASEQVEVSRTIERLYLANPSVTLHLEAEDREIATYPATADLQDAAARVIGTAFRRGSFAVAGDLPGGRVDGFLGRPTLAAPSTHALYLAVNGRSIDARPIQQAARAAFGEYLPRSRFPVGVLHLTLDPGEVDVNVHPTKREVRFARARETAEAIRVAVRRALLAAPQSAELPETAGPRTGAAEPPSTKGTASGRRAAVAAVSAVRSVGQRTLTEVAADARPPEVGATALHPRLSLLGCFRALYWVAESDDGIVLIDQHAASERVTYEALRRDRALARQSLVEPYPIRLSGAQRAALAAHATEVARAGFDIAEFGPGRHAVRAVPEFAGRRVRPESVLDLLTELAAGGRPTEPDGLIERTTASLACHAAIRAGDRVAPLEFSRVLEALYALPESSYSCPHGRPIVIELPRSRLDRWFLRQGP